MEYDKFLLIGENKIISLRDNRIDEELLKRFAENSIATLGGRFGDVDTISIRYDLIDKLPASPIYAIGGNNNELEFAHIINADNDTYKITQLIIVQKQAPAKSETKFIEKTKKIINDFINKIRGE